MTATEMTMKDRRKELLLFYKFCEPVERLFYDTLRARYREMSVIDIAVCRAAYIKQKCGGSPVYDRRAIWTFHNTPEWSRYLLENVPLLLPPNQPCRTIMEANKIIQ